jgi:tetratricopeptide (TPR) repeat protein
VTDRHLDIQEATSLYREGKYEHALSKLIATNLARPDSPDVIIGLARTFEKLGRYSECSNQWQRLKNLTPKRYDNANKLHHVAVLIETGDFDKAEALLKDVDDIHQDNGRKWELIERFLHCTGRAGNTTERGASAGRSVGNAPFNGANLAGKIVSDNEDLRVEYESLIKNTASTQESLSFNSIILVTYGRTGSTLLQGILNSINGVYVLGENDNAFYHLFEYTRTVQQLARRKPGVPPSSPFFGAGELNPELAMNIARNAVDSFFAPFTADPAVACFGFKEVRFKDHPETLSAYLDFLEDIFPEPAFIFLWRDHDAVLGSGWWKTEDKLQVGKLLQKIETIAQEFSSTRNNCFNIEYSDLGANSDRLQSLFEFLGASFDPDRIARILNIPHSYDPERPEVRALFDNASKHS